MDYTLARQYMIKSQIHPNRVSDPFVLEAMGALPREAFVAEKTRHCVTVFACFDNEEVGSNTKQGAMSTLLHDTLTRANAALGMNEEDYLRALSRSFLVRCDNAHALHPNHAELYDAVNRCHLNGGPVVKGHGTCSETATKKPHRRPAATITAQKPPDDVPEPPTAPPYRA